MELSTVEKQYFDTGGQAEISENETPETTEVPDTPESAEVPKAEEKPERKTPSKFEYSPDTDNVTDDLGRKYVPLGAIQEARNENKELRRNLKEMADKYEVGNKRVEEILKRISDVSKQEDVPKYEENPLEHLRAQNEALTKKIQEIETGHGEQRKLTEQQQQLQKFHNSVNYAEAKFAEKTPDYGEAVTHMRNLWAAEFETAGVPAESLEAAIAQRGAQVAFAAMQRGMNPAEAVYELAKRVGYTAKKSEPKEKSALKTIAQGQEASKSLASGKGDASLSLEAIAQWSEDQFEEFASDPKKWKQLK